MASRFFWASLAALITAACHGNTPTSPTGAPGQAATPTPAPPTSVPAAASFTLSGIVTDDTGSPIPGARVAISYSTSAGPVFYYSQIFAASGADGRYSASFTAVAGAMKGPAGTESAVAFVWASASGYDWDNRYTPATDHTPVQDFRLRRVVSITAGDSAPVTVDRDAPVCSNNVQDMHPWPSEFICRTIHIIAPRDGVLTAEVSTASGSVPPKLEMETIGVPGFWADQIGNPLSATVAAGAELVANVELPWGSPTDASIVLKTSIAMK